LTADLHHWPTTAGVEARLGPSLVAAAVAAFGLPLSTNQVFHSDHSIGQFHYRSAPGVLIIGGV
jgi:hypothetical protein